MKNPKPFFFIFLTLILASCKTPTYMFTSGPRSGVNFTSGRWLMNELDCPKKSKDKLTEESLAFFKKNLGDRLFYINDVNGLLISRKIHLNPNKTKLKELKDGTGFDFFINISTTKRKSDFSYIELYQSDDEVGKNEAAVLVEIYDLNSQEIIYSQNVVDISQKTKTEPMWSTEKSNKFIDNVEFYKTSDKLMKGALKKIFKDLDKRSVK
ncbi:hypothetical protein SOM12_06450 [Flavobacterium sp. CFBP9031]|uniref:hypothetical protein n=1 Tax=Flavobacterium sp. CFBP9031 TaxID=3096538 RepID=UPI002A6ABEE4|nr:hypothetical protein [Flavobacterium sp. CFBP9031]MDY0987049.1 hypothetical protein [Flavobacterium sp. CFBP9031]